MVRRPMMSHRIPIITSWYMKNMMDVYRTLTNKPTAKIKPKTTHGSIKNVFFLRAPTISNVEIRIVMHKFIAKMILTMLWSTMSINIVFHSTFKVKIKINEIIDKTMPNIPVNNVPVFNE